MVTQPTPRDTHRYRYPDGYAGITNNPPRRAGEHRRNGRRGKMTVIKPAVTRRSALEWERNQFKVRSHRRRLANGKTVTVRSHKRTKTRRRR